MKRVLMAAAIATPLALSVGAVGPLDGPHVASAAAITCEGNQGPQRVNGEWKCVNGAGNPTGSARTKNPNDRK